MRTRLQTAPGFLCSATDVDLFSDETDDGRAQARTVCLRCPRLTTCLRNEARDSTNNATTLAGLTTSQRRALVIATTLGEAPDVDRASELLQPWWRSIVTRLMSRHPEPSELAAALTREGADCSPATARLLLWWHGQPGALIQPRPRRRRVDAQQILESHRSTLTRLSDLRMPAADIADYLGVPRPAVTKALTAATRESARSADSYTDAA
jgi:hypothetical protein